MTVDVGVGYEPALDLMPLLTMDPVVTLLPGYTPPDTCTYSTTIASIADVGATVDRIVTTITEHAAGVAGRFPDADAIERAMPRRQPAHEPDTADDEPDPRIGPNFDDNGHTQLRLALLAAAGRHDDARALLATYPTPRDGTPTSRAEHRFTRQLTRWLDTGGPAAPPLADTLTQLPRDADTDTPRPELRSAWAAAQDRRKARDDARDAVKPLIAGKNVDQITAMLTAEYAHRDIDATVSEVAFTADALHWEHQLTQQPFGRARASLKAVGLLIHFATDAIRAVRSKHVDVPAWLQPPERASYPITSPTRHQQTQIILDPDAHDWHTRAWTDTPRRVGPTATVTVWLTRDTTTANGLTAHIGDRRIGTIPANASSAYTPALRAAALFDEDPAARGTLTQLASSRTLILEIPTPSYRPQ